MKKIKLSEIKINEAFVKSIPSESKMQECRNNWNMWHKQDRYIVVNHNNVLIDGYIQYLVLKENNVKEVEIKISTRRKKRWYRKILKIGIFHIIGMRLLHIFMVYIQIVKVETSLYGEFRNLGRKLVGKMD